MTVLQRTPVATPPADGGPAGIPSTGRRRLWAWVRVLGTVAILAVLVWRVGADAFVHGLRQVDAWALLAAAVIALMTTVAAAWRWRVVAHGLDVELPLRTAIAAYYRSQFLNTALPGGVLGDVHRAVWHGRDVGDLGAGVRAVVWERVAGQFVQIVLALAVLLAFPSPVPVAFVVAGLVAALAVVVVLVRMRRDVVPIARNAWPAVLLASVVVVAGHAATFLIAADTAGVQEPLTRMLPLALLVLLAMAIPINVGGWGPREGVAAWAFAAAGLGAAHGVAAATVFGVLVLVASLPGAAVLMVMRHRRGAGAVDADG